MVFEYFTPITGSIGGALIGLSAATLLLFSGDILGASGIVSSTLLSPIKSIKDPTVAWKLIFLSTFVLLSNIVLGKYFTNDERLNNKDPSIPIVSIWGHMIGGIFVGFGTRLSNGCPCGHGICGMARLSIRSIVAVCVFMITAFAIATLTAPTNQLTSKAFQFLRRDEPWQLYNRWFGFSISMIIIVLPTCIAMYNLFNATTNTTRIDNKNNQDTNKEKHNSEKKATKKATTRRSTSLTLQGSTTKFSIRSMLGRDGGDDDDKDDDTHDVKPAATTSTIADDVDSTALVAEGGSSSSSSSTTDADDDVATSSPVVDDDGNDDGGDDDDDVIVVNRRKIIPAIFASIFFAVGLAVSGMVLPSKVLGFLNLMLFAEKGQYDPTLLTVMISGCLVSFLSYQFVKPIGIFATKNPYAQECPLLLVVPSSSRPTKDNNNYSTSSFSSNIPTSTLIDIELVGGAFCFGIGWGIAGLCPGQALFLAATGTFPVICCWWPACLVGALLAQTIKR